MKYIRKPEIIEAIQWTGENYDEVYEFVGQKLGRDLNKRLILHIDKFSDAEVMVTNYIIKGRPEVDLNTFYVLSESIFKMLYDEYQPTFSGEDTRKWFL